MLCVVFLEHKEKQSHSNLAGRQFPKIFTVINRPLPKLSRYVIDSPKCSYPNSCCKPRPMACTFLYIPSIAAHLPVETQDSTNPTTIPQWLDGLHGGWGLHSRHDSPWGLHGLSCLSLLYFTAFTTMQDGNLSLHFSIWEKLGLLKLADKHEGDGCLF